MADEVQDIRQYVQQTVKEIQNRDKQLQTPQMANATITLCQTLVSKFASHKKPGAARLWIEELEGAFDLCEDSFSTTIPERLRVAIAVSKLEHHYRKWSTSLHPDVSASWTTFKQHFLEKHDPSHKNLEMQIFEHQQGKYQTLEEYFLDFKTLVQTTFAGQEVYPT